MRLCCSACSREAAELDAVLRGKRQSLADGIALRCCGAPHAPTTVCSATTACSTDCCLRSRPGAGGAAFARRAALEQPGAPALALWRERDLHCSRAHATLPLGRRGSISILRRLACSCARHPTAGGLHGAQGPRGARRSRRRGTPCREGACGAPPASSALVQQLSGVSAAPGRSAVCRAGPAWRAVGAGVELRPS